MSSELQTNLDNISATLNRLITLSTKIINHTELPYVSLQYIQSSATQYIDTGIKPNPTIDIEITFKHTGSNTSYWDRAFGQNQSAGNAKYQLEAVGVPSWKVGLNGVTANISMNARNQFEKFKLKGNGQYYLNDVLKGNLNTSTTNNYNIWLFRGYDRYSYIAVSRARLWQDNILVRDLIPVKRKSDNAICMYDLITDTFFTNAGSGTFIAGPEI